MNIDDAVKVLNEFKHNGCTNWVFRDNYVAPLSAIGGPRQDWLALSSREAIAMATWLESKAGRDMPATRKLLKRLSDDAFHQNRAEKHLGYKWAEMASMIRRDELEAALAEWPDHPKSGD